VARDLPEGRLLIETDSPYLAPLPFRGQRNEPGHVVKVLELLADLRGVDRDVLGARLVENFDRLFGTSDSL
jgi:TatD DNase family protein